MRAFGLAAALVVAAGPARATPLDHRGQWGLALAPGYSLLSTANRSLGSVVLYGPTLALSGTLAIGDTGEWIAVASGGPVGLPTPFLALAAGYRAYFGDDAFKTFVEPLVLVHFTPFARAGAVLSVGAQYDFTPSFGAFVEGGVSGLVGSGLAGGVVVSAGAQVRFF